MRKKQYVVYIKKYNVFVAYFTKKSAFVIVWKHLRWIWFKRNKAMFMNIWILSIDRLNHLSIN